MPRERSLSPGSTLAIVPDPSASVANAAAPSAASASYAAAAPAPQVSYNNGPAPSHDSGHSRHDRCVASWTGRPASDRGGFFACQGLALSLPPLTAYRWPGAPASHTCGARGAFVVQLRRRKAGKGGFAHKKPRSADHREGAVRVLQHHGQGWHPAHPTRSGPRMEPLMARRVFPARATPVSCAVHAAVPVPA